MEVVTAESVLEHYGVKGMKWGVRKKGTQSSTATRLGRVARKATGGGGPDITGPTPRSKAKKKYKADKASAKAAIKPVRKAEAKMSRGEKVVSALVAGPIGMGLYKGGKIVSARANNPAVFKEDD